MRALVQLNPSNRRLGRDITQPNIFHLWQRLNLGQIDIDVVVWTFLLEIGAEELLESPERRLDDVVGDWAELAALAEAVELEVEHDARILLRPLLELDAMPSVQASVHLRWKSEAKSFEYQLKCKIHCQLDDVQCCSF